MSDIGKTFTTYFIIEIGMKSTIAAAEDKQTPGLVTGQMVLSID